MEVDGAKRLGSTECFSYRIRRLSPLKHSIMNLPPQTPPRKKRRAFRKPSQREPHYRTRILHHPLFWSEKSSQQRNSKRSAKGYNPPKELTASTSSTVTKAFAQSMTDKRAHIRPRKRITGSNATATTRQTNQVQRQKQSEKHGSASKRGSAWIAAQHPLACSPLTNK